MNKHEKLINLLKKDKLVYIQTHNFPDPDAIGSAFALQFLLKHYNIKSKIIYHGYIAEKNTLFMIKKLRIKLYSLYKIKIQPNEKIIAVDAQIENTNIKKINAKYIAFIDHHEKSTLEYPKFFDLRSTIGSCSTIIGSYIASLHLKHIPQNIATALLIGLYIDTNGLIRKTTSEDVKVFYTYFELANHKLFNYFTLNSISLNDLQYFEHGIKHIYIHKNIGILHFNKLHSQQLLGIISDFFMTIKELSLIISYFITKKNIHIAIRSESKKYKKYNSVKLINRIVDKIGTGGGHTIMAGGIIELKNVPKNFNMKNHIFNVLRKTIKK